MLILNNIETKYDRLSAVRGLSLGVAEREVTAVIGPNGAGKTTILNTVMGLLDDQPDRGTIEYRGKRIDGLDTAEIVRRGISYVPEGREIFEELTVLENLQAGGLLHGRRGKHHARVEKVLDYFPGLKRRIRLQAGYLSGGEQQMLAIGRALMNDPALLLLDEPSLGLSPRLVAEIFAIISRLRQEGVTLLLMEQNARAALQVADFVLVLENGRFVRSGTPQELSADEDIREFYLGVRREESIKGAQRYRRKRRWN